ncbi:unnamed protein product [Penicillium glandicola]
MTLHHSWFQGPELHNIVFDPTPSTWIILEHVNEHEHRKNPDHSSVSYASVKYRCRKYDDASKIAAWTPPELVAYKTLTDKQSKVTPQLLGYREEKQASSALMPGGFLVSFVWEQVPGVQLGNSLGAKVFWGMSDDQRHIIREAFKKTIRFMVGFRQWIEVKPTPWSEAKSYWFDLAKPPQNVDWSEWAKKPDTSN